MSKFAKIFLGIVVFVLAVVAVALWLFFSNINSVAKRGIEHYGSEALGTSVRVNSVKLSPFDGKGTVSGLSVMNPEGFDSAEALSLDLVRVAVDIESLTGSVIVIDEITVDGAKMLVEQKLKGGNNLDALRRNAEQYAGSEKPDPEEAVSEYRIAIKAFNYTGVEVEVRADGIGEQRVSVPDVRLTNIGDASSGLSIGEAISRMLKPIVSAALKDALKGQLEGKLKGGLDGLLEKNDKLRGLTGLLGGAKSPPED